MIVDTITCGVCGEETKKSYKYFGFDFCEECYEDLELIKLENVKPPLDSYLRARLNDPDVIIGDALTLFATLHPKSLAKVLMFLCLTSKDDEEMTPEFIMSMIMAARSLWLFGYDSDENAGFDDKIIALLQGLGKLVITATKVRALRGRNGFIKIEILTREDNIIRGFIENLRLKDDGTLGPYLDGLEPLVYNFQES